jgi:hypothetical protein
MPKAGKAPAKAGARKINPTSRTSRASYRMRVPCVGRRSREEPGGEARPALRSSSRETHPRSLLRQKGGRLSRPATSVTSATPRFRKAGCASHGSRSSPTSKSGSLSCVRRVRGHSRACSRRWSCAVRASVFSRRCWRRPVGVCAAAPACPLVGRVLRCALSPILGSSFLSSWQ